MDKKKWNIENKPPSYALRFFRWFCHPDYAEDIEGDLHERFEAFSKSMSPQKARRRFSIEVLRLCRPGIIKPIELNNPIIHPAMIRHNLLISYRGFLRDKSTFFINLLGLSTGIACAFLIALWIQSEWRINRFHEKQDYLHQLIIRYQISSGEIYTREVVPALLGEALEQEIPAIESATMFSSAEESPSGIFNHEGKITAARGLYARENFLNVFSFPLLQGNPADVLKDKRSMVISEEMAIKLFGSVSGAIGKTLEWDNSYIGGLFTVTGVLDELPSYSTLDFDFLMNIALFLDAHEWARQWNGSSVESFVLLRPGTDLNNFNRQIESFIAKKTNKANAPKKRLFTQKYVDRYLYNRFESGVLAGGRIDYLRLFATIGLFILCIACVNFMNLSTARASTKMKQIGVKKAIGASKKTLVFQFLGESILITLMASVLALILVYLFLPHFSQLIGKELAFIPNGYLLPILGAIILFTGFLSGSYPAFFLSALKPLDTLKGKLSGSLEEIGIRKGLVVFQFTLSFIFIVAVIIIYQQMEFTQNKHLGYNRENVVYFQRTSQPYEVSAFMAQVREIPGVLQATNIHGGSIVGNKNRGSGFSWTGSPEEEGLMFMRPQVDYNFLETLDMEIQAGRSFSREYGEEESKLIINEAAADLMNLDDPIGTIIQDGDYEKEIIGIVKNFHIKSLHEEMEPCIIRFSPGGHNVMARIQAGREKETLKQLKTLYESYHPGYSFAYSFLDEEYQKLYQSEMRVASLSRYFSAMAILISCLGLLGLAAYTAEQRKKEIGIRKILGASISQLVGQLSGDFSRTVLVAIFIAIPISYLLANSWLSTFAYKISLHPGYFFLSALVLMLIAGLTVLTQTWKAAHINPVECLKDE